MPLTGISPAIHVPAAGGGAFTGARLTMVTDPGVVNSSPVPFNNVAKDTSGFTGIQAYKFVIPVGMGGTYRVTAALAIYTNGTANGYAANIVRQIGGVGTPPVIATQSFNDTAAFLSDVSTLLCADAIDLTAGDVLWVYWQNPGSGLGYLLGGVSPLANNYFSIQKIG